MISAFANTLRIPELRARILFTLILIIVYRIGAQITCPGVNGAVIQQWFHDQGANTGGSVAALFNIFSGGALENCAVFSLGVMPYISASIMLQLLAAVIPQLAKMVKEDGGRQKLMQYTRYATILLCIFQGWFLAVSFENPATNPFLPGIAETIEKLGTPLVAVMDQGLMFRILTVITLTSGTLLLMWLGDQITERGIGNGMSMIITVGIVARLPAGLIQAWNTIVGGGDTPGQSNFLAPMQLVFMLGFLLLVVAGVICITQATRRISVQYTKKVVGRKQFGGQTQYMPLKINYSGVMPIIFAQAFLLFPTTILNMFGQGNLAVRQIVDSLSAGWVHYLVSGLLIFGFSYFWVATQFHPQQIAEDLKKYGGYVPGVRPGKDTANFLDRVMTRLTFAGAVFLTVIAVMPQMLSEGLKIPYATAQFFGGTSLLIMVGVVLDTMRQVETFLMQRSYEGFLRKGKIRGRSGDRSPEARGEAVAQNTLVWLWAVAAVLVLVVATIMLAQRMNP